MRQHRRKRVDPFPLPFGQCRRRQAPELCQRRCKPLMFRERDQQLLHPLLECGPVRRLLSRPGIPACGQRSCARHRSAVGRQQQFGKRAPLGDRGDRRWRQSIEPCECRERSIRGARRGRVADQCKQGLHAGHGNDRMDPRELGFDGRLQQPVDRGAKCRSAAGSQQLGQPQFARTEHFLDQTRQQLRFVIQGARKPVETRRDRNVAIELRDSAPGRLGIKRPGIVDQRRRRADACRERQAPRKPVIEAVDGLHVQARRIVFETPVAFAAARERGARMPMNFQFVRLGRRRRRFRGTRQCR